MVTSLCVEVPKKEAEDALRLLRNAGCLRRGLKPHGVGEYLRVPVEERPQLSEIVSSKSWTICRDEFQESMLGKTFKDLLKGAVPDEVLEEIPRSYQLVGDIALIHLPPEAEEYGRLIGEAIMKVSKGVKAVYSAGPVEGEYRVRSLRLIAGEPKTSTIHREYGVSICVDVEKTYFNPSLSEEHVRVARMVRDGEAVADLFCGVGPFTLQIAALRKEVVVYAVDINPHAITCLLRSLQINRGLRGKVQAVCGDASVFLEAVKDRFFHRIIMNLPHGAINFLGKASRKLRCGGVIHLYTVAESADEAVSLVQDAAGDARELRVREALRVLDYAPHKYVYRVDVYKEC